MGHSPILEGDLSAGDVFVVGEDAAAHGGNARDFRRNEGKNDVNVVNHQVEHHAHVVDARGKRPDALGLQEKGRADGSGDVADGAVEALDVSHLKHQVVPRSDVQQLLGLAGTRRNGFFDEDMNAHLQGLFSYRVV